MSESIVYKGISNEDRNREVDSSSDGIGTGKRQKKLTEYANIQAAMKSNMKEVGSTETLRKIPGKMAGNDNVEQCRDSKATQSEEENRYNTQQQNPN